MSNFNLTSIPGIEGPVIHHFRYYEHSYMEIYQLDLKSPLLTIAAILVHGVVRGTSRQEDVHQWTYTADSLPLARLSSCTSASPNMPLSLLDICYADSGMTARIPLSQLRCSPGLPKTMPAGKAAHYVREDTLSRTELLARIRELEKEVNSLNQFRRSASLAVTAMRSDVRTVTQTIADILSSDQPQRGRFRL